MRVTLYVIEPNYFISTLLLYIYFKINGWMHIGILGVLVKFSINLISFSLIPLNYEASENFKFWGENNGLVSPSSTHSITSYLSSQVSEWSFHSF